MAKPANKKQVNQQSKPKIGKSVDDIFGSKNKEIIAPIVHEEVEPIKEVEAPKEEKQARGRPVEHNESWSKVTVVLLDKQIHWLDQLASTIRLNTKVAISRAELIRSVIAAIEESGLDLSNLKNERDITNFLLQKLGSQ